MTLVVALAVMAFWTRSMFVRDDVCFSSSTVGCDTEITTTSVYGELVFMETVELPLREDLPIIWHRPEWNAWNNEGATVDSLVADDFPWRFRICGFGYGWGQEVGMFGAYRTSVWMIPYWSIVTPLTLLSAWLLLSKSRVAKLSAHQST